MMLIFDMSEKSNGFELSKIIPDGTILVSMLPDKTITKSANLFSELPHSLPEELIEILVDAPNIRIERIISTGHASLPEFWYDQAESESNPLLTCSHRFNQSNPDYPATGTHTSSACSVQARIITPSRATGRTKGDVGASGVPQHTSPCSVGRAFSF
jgi:hypothetical protein